MLVYIGNDPHFNSTIRSMSCWNNPRFFCIHIFFIIGMYTYFKNGQINLPVHFVIYRQYIFHYFSYVPSRTITKSLQLSVSSYFLAIRRLNYPFQTLWALKTQCNLFHRYGCCCLFFSLFFSYKNKYEIVRNTLQMYNLCVKGVVRNIYVDHCTLVRRHMQCMQKSMKILVL